MISTRNNLCQSTFYEIEEDWISLVDFMSSDEEKAHQLGGVVRLAAHDVSHICHVLKLCLVSLICHISLYLSYCHILMLNISFSNDHTYSLWTLIEIQTIDMDQMDVSIQPMQQMLD